MRNYKIKISAVFVFLTAATMVIPMNGLGAIQYTNGSIPTANGDLWYYFDYASTADHADGGGIWTVGNYITDLGWRDYSKQSPPDAYNRYIDELYIPWIRIKYDGMNVQTYQFSWNDLSTLRIAYTGGNTIDESSDANGADPTVIGFTYDLDIDNNLGNGHEFQFTIENLYYGSVDSVGYIQSEITCGVCPKADGVPYKFLWPGEQNARTCDFIEFAFVLHAHPYNSATNKVQFWSTSGGIGHWVTQNIEDNKYDGSCEHTGAGVAVKIQDDDANRQVRVGRSENGQHDLWYYFNRYHGNECSNHPSAYDNNENINNMDVDLWMIERWEDIGNYEFPTPENGLGPILSFHQFTA